MKQSLSRILFGLALILAGLGYAGDALGFWNFNLFFSGWWTLFIIIPCLVSIIENGFDTGNVLGLVLGILLFLSAQGLIRLQTMLQLFFPALLIILGISLLLRPNRVPVPAGDPAAPPASPLPEITTAFSSETRRITNSITSGARLTAVFGSLTIDLRQATIAQSIPLETTAIFGSIHLLLPENVRVTTKSFSLFGSTSNQTPSDLSESLPCVFIQATNIFGSTQVRL